MEVFSGTAFATARDRLTTGGLERGTIGAPTLVTERPIGSVRRVYLFVACDNVARDFGLKPDPIFTSISGGRYGFTGLGDFLGLGDFFLQNGPKHLNITITADKIYVRSSDMWIDTRTKDLKVYETQPSDPWIKKMTWVPEENAWVLFETPVPVVEFADMMAAGGNPEFVRQAEIIRKFSEGKMSYAEMRMHCG